MSPHFPLPPPPWEGLPWQRTPSYSNPISEDEFLKHVAEKYRVHIPEGIIRITEPISTAALTLGIAGFHIKQPPTRDSGFAMYYQAREDVVRMANTGILDAVAAGYANQQLNEIEEALRRANFGRAGSLMYKLGVHLDLLRVFWMASQARTSQ